MAYPYQANGDTTWSIKATVWLYTRISVGGRFIGPSTGTIYLNTSHLSHALPLAGTLGWGVGKSGVDKENTFMRVLVIGSGAREHALAWKLAQSRRITYIYAAPGNPGMAPVAECVPLGVTQIAELADFARRNAIDLTVVGPEIPLVAGIVDVFQQHGLPIFGPLAAGAALEGSKAFAKEL